MKLRRGYAPLHKLEGGARLLLVELNFPSVQNSRPGGGVQIKHFLALTVNTPPPAERGPSPAKNQCAILRGGFDPFFEGGLCLPSKNQGGAFAPPVPMALPPMFVYIRYV